MSQSRQHCRNQPNAAPARHISLLQIYEFSAKQPSPSPATASNSPFGLPRQCASRTCPRPERRCRLCLYLQTRRNCRQTLLDMVWFQDSPASMWAYAATRRPLYSRGFQAADDRLTNNLRQQLTKSRNHIVISVFQRNSDSWRGLYTWSGTYWRFQIVVKPPSRSDNWRGSSPLPRRAEDKTTPIRSETVIN